MNKIIHASEMRDYPGAIYIGRAMPRRKIAGSIWGNPYKSGKTLSTGEYMSACGLYEAYLMMNHDLVRQLHQLRGKPLACWCVRASDPDRHPSSPYRCHGDVIAEILRTHTDADLIDWSNRIGRTP